MDNSFSRNLFRQCGIIKKQSKPRISIDERDDQEVEEEDEYVGFFCDKSRAACISDKSDSCLMPTHASCVMRITKAW